MTMNKPVTFELPRHRNRRIGASPAVARVEPINSSVKHCRMFHDFNPLRKTHVHDLITEVCCVLHSFRVRLTPWQPMV
jgi:hypothetical protein